MSQRWVSSLEAGEIDMPGAKTMRRLSQVLGIPLADLYIAGQWAKSRADAARIAEAVPDDDDPTLSVLMAGARQLTPTGRRMLVEHLRVIERLQREFEEEAARDALGGGGGGRRAD